MRSAERLMKLLKVSDDGAQFLDEKGAYQAVDGLKKEDLLRLATLALEGADIELDEYIEGAIKNQAHQIIYRNVYQKLSELRKRRDEFRDEAARKYLESYQKYCGDLGK